LKNVNIIELQSLLSAEHIIWTEHLSFRLIERDIKRAAVITCINNGEIIEQYPNAYPYPACLISAMLENNEPLHVVAGTNESELFILTAYKPTLEKWENDYKTRKEGK
jgi:hypothetical protein